MFWDLFGYFPHPSPSFLYQPTSASMCAMNSSSGERTLILKYIRCWTIKSPKEIQRLWHIRCSSKCGQLNISESDLIRCPLKFINSKFKHIRYQMQLPVWATYQNRNLILSDALQNMQDWKLKHIRIWLLSDGVEIQTCSCQYRPHILAHLDQRPHSKAANMSNVYTNTNTANMNASYQTTKSNMVKKGETCKKPASPVPAWPNDTRGELWELTGK